MNLAGPNKHEAFLIHLKRYHNKKRPKSDLKSSSSATLSASDEAAEEDTAEDVFVPATPPAEREKK